MMDQIHDEDTETSEWMKGIAIREAIKKLDKRKQKILALRFWRGKTQMEVADEIGISQAQVSRLEQAALKRMNELM